jgi:phage tail sheath gpL-like
MIPTTLRVPIFAAEFDSSRAFSGPATLNYKAILLGNKIAAGTMAQATITRCSSVAEARRLAGDGSVLERMFDAWYASNRLTEVYLYSFDDAAHTAAVGTLVITGTPTAAGSLAVYIGGRRISVAITTTSTPTTIGADIVTAITADTRMAVTAVNTAGSVALTAKNKGIVGGVSAKPTIDLRANYNDGEYTPAGLTVTTTAQIGTTVPGVGSPDGTAWSNFFDAVADDWIQVFVGPWSDATSLTAIETELSSRFGYDRMIDGYYFTANLDTKANLQSFGNGRNSKHVVCPGVYKPCGRLCELAASFAAQITKEAQVDPARPFQTLELMGLLPPARADRFDPLNDNNALLFDGISTLTTDSGGKVRIQRAITMYQTNPAGADDIAYLDVNTGLTLMYLRYSLRMWFLTRYPRAKLADDASRIAPGQSVITPKIGKAECIAWARAMEVLGLVENIDQFKSDLQVVRNSQDPNRLDFVIPPDLVNQFIVGAAQIQFLLQSPA